MYVIAYRRNGVELLFAGLALSDASGQYVLSELPAATYRISFRDPTSTHISEWYMDAADGRIRRFDSHLISWASPMFGGTLRRFVEIPSLVLPPRSVDFLCISSSRW